MHAVGWVRVRLLGAVSGRRLNLLSQRMKVKNVCVVRGGMELDVRARDLNELRRMLHGAGLHMRIVRRYGIVNVRRMAKRRGALVVAALTMLLVLGSLSQTVLSVRVEGAKDVVQERQMLTVLEECGVKKGVYVGSVDRYAAAQEVLSRFSGITYAALRRQGFAMELYVVQATQAPEVFDASVETDVVAQVGGLVTRVVALSGEAMVRPGDTVVPGQVLIAGTERMPHARGAVTARVWAVGRGEAGMYRENRSRTGETFVESFVRMGSITYPERRISGFAEEEMEEKSTLLLDGLFYPVELVKCVHHEIIQERQIRKMSDVKDESGARAMTDALLNLKNGACVVDKRVEYSMIEDGKLCAVVTLESVMQIGQERVRDVSGAADKEE